MSIISRVVIAVILLSICQSSLAFAERIRVERYSYDMELAKDAQIDDPFVICSKCSDDKLSVEPAPLQIAVKFIDVPASLPKEDPVEEKCQETTKETTVIIPSSQPRLVETIIFDFDNSKIKATEKKKIAGISGAVTLKGYTCVIGTDKYNFGLSKRRADSVASYLRKHGVKILDANGLGKSTKFSEKQLNRRVEIYERGEK